eukprot:2732660-Ditylum_brightwellii.AAC.1
MRCYFHLVVKYLCCTGSTVPTWWTATHLVGCILSDESQGALVHFTNSMRMLEGASMHEIEIESKIRDLVAVGDLEDAHDVLMRVAVQKALRKHKNCSICSEPMHDNEDEAMSGTGTEDKKAVSLVGTQLA